MTCLRKQNSQNLMIEIKTEQILKKTSIWTHYIDTDWKTFQATDLEFKKKRKLEFYTYLYQHRHYLTLKAVPVRCKAQVNDSVTTSDHAIKNVNPSHTEY